MKHRKSINSIIMLHERIEAGKSASQIIDGAMQHLDQGLYDRGEREAVVATLLTARITTLPESDDRKKIDELLRDIEVRYGDA